MKFKINPLEINRLILIWVCAIPADKNTSKSKRLLYALISLIIFVALLSVSLASGAFIVKFVSTDLEGSFYALAQLAAYSAMTYTIIVTFFIRDKIPSIFDNLAKVCESSKKLFYLNILMFI